MLDFELCMKEAISLAAGGFRGRNPLVGAVIMSNSGIFLGSGCHLGSGSEHGEVVALRQVSDSANLSDATLFVSLQPCDYEGVTGSCVDRIIDSGISRVVYAGQDPTGHAASSNSKLVDAGVEVVFGVLEKEAEEVNLRWKVSVEQKRPFVTLHMAQTLDGKIAASDRSSRWITSFASLRDNHLNRSFVDAVLVGTQTVFFDDPYLNARISDGQLFEKQPLRVVMGYRDISDKARIIGSDNKFLHITSRDPEVVLDRLYRDYKVGHLLIEGGSKIAAAFLKNDLVDEIIMYLAPKILGPGVDGVANLDIHNIDQAMLWEWDNIGDGAVKFLGDDIKLRLTPRRRR